MLEKDDINKYMNWKNCVSNKCGANITFVDCIYGDDKNTYIKEFVAILHEIIKQFNQKDKELRTNKADERQELVVRRERLKDIEDRQDKMSTGKGRNK